MTSSDIEKGRNKAEIINIHESANLEFPHMSKYSCHFPATNVFNTILADPTPEPGLPTSFSMLEAYSKKDMNFFFNEGSYTIEFPKHALLHIRHLEAVICDAIAEFDSNEDSDPLKVSEKMEKIGKLLHEHGTPRLQNPTNI